MRFLIILITSGVLALSAIAFLNYTVDPLGVQALQNPMERPDCGMHTERRWTMPLTLAWSNSSSLVSGTSHMRHGFAEKDLETYFGVSPVINAGLPAMTVTEMRWLLEPPMKTGKLHHLLLGIEYAMFSGRFPGHRASLQEDIMEWRPIKNIFQPYFSLSATKAAWHARHADCSSAGNTAKGFPAPKQVRFFKKPDKQGYIHQSEKNTRNRNTRTPFNRDAYRNALAAFDALLTTGCGHRITMDLIIPPNHHRMEEAYYSLGLSTEINQWKHDVLQRISTRQQQGCRIRLFDFHGHNTITASPFLQPDGTIASTPWYYEPSHFTPATGRCILASLQGDPYACTDQPFGQELHTGMLESHLASLSQQQERYWGHQQEQR